MWMALRAAIETGLHSLETQGAWVARRIPGYDYVVVSPTGVHAVFLSTDRDLVYSRAQDLIYEIGLYVIPVMVTDGNNIMDTVRGIPLVSADKVSQLIFTGEKELGWAEVGEAVVRLKELVETS